MTHRERVLAAVRRQPPDHQPVDLGSTLATTLTAGAQQRLRAHLGLPAAAPAAVLLKRSQTVVPDQAILERFDIDTRAVLLGAAERRPDRPLNGDGFIDEWQVTWTRPAGGHYLSTDGPFYHLAEPSVRDLENFDWPEAADPGRYRGIRERARELHEGTDCAVVLTLGVGPVHQAQFLRGYGEWLEDLILRPGFAGGLLDYCASFLVEVARRALTEAGQYIDIVMFGDDVGTQRGPLVSPGHYRRFIKPAHRRIVEAIHRFGKPVLYHTCGSVAALIPDFIDIGVDILNPIQVSAAHMDTAALKRDYGRHIAFWGAVDNQSVLPHGTPDDVRAEVRRRIRDLAPGGYILAAAHNIQADVPPENIVVMYDTARESSSW